MIRIFFAHAGGPPPALAVPDIVLRDRSELTALLERGRTGNRALDEGERRIVQAINERLVEDESARDFDVVANSAVFKIFAR
jgi:hypothetical protein